LLIQWQKYIIYSANTFKVDDIYYS